MYKRPLDALSFVAFLAAAVLPVQDLSADGALVDDFARHSLFQSWDAGSLVKTGAVGPSAFLVDATEPYMTGAPLESSRSGCVTNGRVFTSPVKGRSGTMITNAAAGTRVDEVAEGIYRISTPVTILPGGFTFNQYLLLDDEPLLFHTGPRHLFPLVSEAVAAVMALDRLRYVGLSHFEADECGALNEFLEVAPGAVPVCSQVAAMVSVDDVATRQSRPLADGEVLELGPHRVRWIDAPHVPHGWDCGYLFEEKTRTLLCGDLFTQGGAEHPPITESDILGPSEAMRKGMDYFAHGPNTGPVLDRLSALKPTTLACMHGSAWRGDGQALLRALGDSLAGTPVARAR